MTERTQLRVTDFDCPSCASTVERALARPPGVEDVEVHYTTGRIEIEYDPGAVHPDSLVSIVENQGYTAQPE